MGKARPWQAGALLDGEVGGWLAEVRGRPVLPGPGVKWGLRGLDGLAWVCGLSP